MSEELPAIGIVGLGKMGRALVHHIKKTNNKLVVAVEKNLPLGEEVLKGAGIKYQIANDFERAFKVSEIDKAVLTDKLDLVFTHPEVNIVVDCTGDIKAGAYIGFNSILNRKNLIEVNAELDATIGPLLTKLAGSSDVVYSGDLGDEPGTIMHYLYKPLTEIGLEVLVAGKGKNNPLNQHATPDELLEMSVKSKLNPRVLTSFVDGTKTAVEMTILSNATGLLPDVTGMHGPVANVNDLIKIFQLKKDGGILDNLHVVDYVIGVAPGVFAVATTDDNYILENLRYLKIGDGPNFLFYRPYHLPGSETLLAIINAVRRREPVIKAIGYYSETIAVAKRELQAGEILDGIGGYTVYGVIEKKSIAQRHGYIPIGLTEGTKLKKNIKKDEPITLDDVELKEGLVTDLWMIQNRLFHYS